MHVGSLKRMFLAHGHEVNHGQAHSYGGQDGDVAVVLETVHRRAVEGMAIAADYALVACFNVGVVVPERA